MRVRFDVIDGTAPIDVNARCLPKPRQNDFQILRAQIRVNRLRREVQQSFVRNLYVVRRRQKFFGKSFAVRVAEIDENFFCRLVIFNPTERAFKTYRHAEIFQMNRLL